MIAFAISEWGYRQSFGDAIIFELLFLPSRLIAVYVNWFLLIPKYLYKNKFVKYFVFLCLLLIIVGIAHRYFVLYWGYPKYFPDWVTNASIEPLNFSRLVQSILIIVSPVAFTTGFKLFLNWFQNRKETEALRQEKTDAELKFLKSQTNPHFLFNTLNSIYGLALEKSEKTPSLILKLSDILSYTLYESNVDKIPLIKELTLIENIISLEKERYEKRVTVTYKVDGNIDDIEIPPLILVPFIENAFKHGLKNEIKKGWINILVKTEEDLLSFSVENSYTEVEEHNEKRGLGLENVSRRLDLIYGEDKDLKIHRDRNIFSVDLTIKFKGNES